MAHVVGNDGNVEPNLIPLLDLVLQLVMFFIMVTNFSSAQVTREVELPVAQSARPRDKDQVDVIYLNVDAEGHLVLQDRDPLTTSPQIRVYIDRVYNDLKDQARLRGDKDGTVNTVVIIRGHRDSDFKQVYEILRECKSAGFRKWQLRATMVNEPST